MKKLLFTLLLATQFMFANNLNITNVQKVGDNFLSFDVSWDNSWWISTYRDASWIFIKYKNSSGQWQHLDINSATVTGFTLFTYSDKKGIMLSRAVSGQGTVTGSVTVQFNGGVLGPLPDFKVFGIEMVYINPGAFYVGDGEGTTNRFHQGNDVNSPYHIQNAGPITVGSTANDLSALDLTANIPATFPNGYNSFYLMKYEITQEQYVAFLNTLTATQQQTRTETDLSAITAANRFVMKASSTPQFRNGIACDATATNTTPITFYCDLNNNSIANENNDGQNIATICNIADITAYTDWAALRLPTEFEYEKACRGTAYPIVNDMANGTTLTVNAGAIVNSGMPNESVSNINSDGLITLSTSPKRVGVFATATSTRLQSGAGFYGNMELSGNVREFYVNPTQISYTGNFGDGILDANGNQNEWSLNGIFHEKGTSTDPVSYRSVHFPITSPTRNLNSRGCR